MRIWLTRIAVGITVAAGVIGLALTAAGVHSDLRTALVLLFLVLAPTAAVARLLRGFDPFARLILSFTTTIAILALTSIIMLMAGVWSPTGELLAILGITAACLAVQLPPVGRRSGARSGAVAAETGRQQP